CQLPLRAHHPLSLATVKVEPSGSQIYREILKQPALATVCFSHPVKGIEKGTCGEISYVKRTRIKDILPNNLNGAVGNSASE
ncbi:hypothetical protein A2U01_0054308, partial [Trifolium medium]|nr:hypothetical protein [Trifolium medium]